MAIFCVCVGVLWGNGKVIESYMGVRDMCASIPIVVGIATALFTCSLRPAYSFGRSVVSDFLGECPVFVRLREGVLSA